MTEKKDGAIPVRSNDLLCGAVHSSGFFVSIAAIFLHCGRSLSISLTLNPSEWKISLFSCVMINFRDARARNQATRTVASAAHGIESFRIWIVSPAFNITPTGG